jgi:hypothetical protein
LRSKNHISCGQNGKEPTAKGRRIPQIKCRTRTENKGTTKRGRRRNGVYFFLKVNFLRLLECFGILTLIFFVLISENSG